MRGNKACGLMIVLFLSSIVIGGCATTPTPAPTATPLVLPTATPTPTPTPFVTPTPIVYVVQPGDTLSSIAYAFDVSLADLMEANQITDPDLLQVGQQLIIPGPMIEPPPTPTPTPTPTPDLPPNVVIGEVVGRGTAEETVYIVNRGQGVRLGGWRLTDAQGHTFPFPDLYLAPGEQVAIHTGVGGNTPLDLYWGLTEPVWGESGDTITLIDNQGVVRDVKTLP